MTTPSTGPTSRRASRRERRSASRRAGAVRAALVSVVVVGLTGTLAVAGGDWFPAGARDVPAPVPVALDSRSTGLVCPGPAALASPGGTDDPGFASTRSETGTTLRIAALGSTTTSVRQLTALDDPAQDATPPTGDDEPEDVVGTDRGAQASLTVEGATALSTVTTGTGSAVAGVASTTSAGDLRGVAAASCQEPGVDQWLVGGGTELGSSTRLVLQNPSRTPATVTLSVWGPTGPLALAGPSTYLVAPGTEVSTLLEGLAAQQRGTVVHVVSEGALVTAYLQHSVLDGLTPAGVDLVVAGDGAATAQVLSGLVVRESAVGDADVASVRVLSPDVDGTATVTVLGADGRHVLRGAETTPLTAGEVTDVNLAGLPAGTYSVVVQADTAVVAGAVVTRVGTADPDEPLIGTPRDRAWVASRHVVDAEPSAVAVPDGLRAVAVLVAVPSDLDGDGAFPADVPIVYAPGTGPADADADADADEDGSTATGAPGSAAVPSVSGTLEAYGADGTRTGTSDVEVLLGQTLRVDVHTTFPGAEVTALRFVPADGAADGLVVDWSVVVADPTLSGSVSVLAPAGPPPGQDELVVRRSPTVGLPGR